MSLIEVPGNVAFAGFYYPEILRELLEDLRLRRDELGLTDENDFETHIQFLRAFSLVGHLNNTRLDTTASELLLGTATLLESIKRLMRLIGVELNSATPAVADLLVTLSGVTTSDQTSFIPELAEFATDSTPPIAYEALQEDGHDLNRTDQVDYVYGLEAEKGGSNGFVNTSAPNIFNRSGGDDIFAAADVNKHVFITTGISDNGGEFRIVEFIDANQVRLVRVPGSKNPNFQTETTLVWSMKAFTSNEATAANTGSSFFGVWATPIADDMLFIGHEHMFSNQLDILSLSVVAAGITGVFEYFDNTHSKFVPSTVVDNGSTITFGVNSLLGTPDYSGVQVIVEYLPTGDKETISSSFSGGVNVITTSGLLGQISASTDLSDYLITANWIPFENQSDGTNDFSQNGAVTYDLPQDIDRNWQKTEVNLQNAYWIRYRIISVSTPTAPTFDRIQLDQDEQHMLIQVTQGETIGPQLIGSSDGSATQEFELPETPFLDDTEEIEVDEAGGGNFVTWTRASNFLNSQANSRHYVRESDAEDKATIRFGDGVNGKVPPAGTDNIRATYRVGGDIDGNVGVNQIVVNADGVSGISEVSNPRSALGWRVKDGGTDSDIIRVKRDKPAELRTRGTASTAGDVENLAVNVFTDSNGTKPVARAFAVEEGLGIKTVKLVVVGDGGTVLSADQKEELEIFFNGDRDARPQTHGVLTMNQGVTVFNFQPSIITVQATVSWPGGNPESIRNALTSVINPLAQEEDGVTYVFEFDGSVSLSRIYTAIHDVDPAIEDVPTLLLNGSPSSVALGSNELPTTTAANIQINIQG